MADVAFYGSEVEAAGWRLAGVPIMVAPTDAPGGPAFERACAGVQLLLVDADTARRLPPARLDALRAAGVPLLYVLPPFAGSAAPDPVVAAARRQLGMDA